MFNVYLYVNLYFVYVCCFDETFFIGKMVAAGLQLLSEMDSTSALFKWLRLANYLIRQLYSSSLAQKHNLIVKNTHNRDNTPVLFLPLLA